MEHKDNKDNNETFHIDKSWHLKKEITIGQIFTMAAIVISALTWGTTVEVRLGILEEQNRVDDISDEADQRQLTQALTRLETKIDDNFERLINLLVEEQGRSRGD